MTVCGDWATPCYGVTNIVSCCRPITGGLDSYLFTGKDYILRANYWREVELGQQKTERKSF